MHVPSNRSRVNRGLVAGPVRSLALVLLAVCGAWCGSGCRSQREPTAVPAAAAAAGASVKPGINAEYLKPDLNVAQWVERFEREGREIYEHRAEVAGFVGLRAGMEVADIGAGSGLFTLMFAQAVGPKGRVFAVDIVKQFLAHIEQRCAEAGVRNVQTVLCTDRSAELPPQSIDRAFICDTYHHFEYPTQTMASIHRALRPGGELVLVEFERIPGTSAEWILGHVRAGRDVFVAGIEAAGFKRIGSADFLKDNYILRFRKVGR